MQELLPSFEVQLSPRELQVLRMKAEGKTYQCIASEIGIARATVREYCDSAVKKLDANSCINAVFIATKLGIIGAKERD